MKKILIFVVLIIAFFGLYRFLSKNPSNISVSDNEAQLIIYWGQGCPHCENVKKYISDNNLDSKIKLSFKEVYYNKDNQSQLTETIRKCPEIDSSKGVGVPLAFDTTTNKCFSGDQPIIDWLKAKVLQ
jgi:glutaredoxin